MKNKIFAVAFTLFILPAVAQSNWTGTSSSNWTDGGNWLGGVAPVSSNSLQVVFAGLGVTGVTVADAPYTLNQLTISGPPTYTLSGNALTLDGASPQILVSGAGNSIANTLIFNVDTVLGAFNDVTLSGGTGGQGLFLPIAGTTVTLSGATVHSGITTIGTGAILRIGDGVTGPGIFFDIVDGGVLELNTAGPISMNGALSGAGTVHVLGGSVTGTVLPWAHAGTTTVDVGATLNTSINNNALLTVEGTCSSTDSTVGSLAGTGTGTVFVNGATLTLGGDNTNQTYVGAMGGGGGLIKNGTGLQTLAATSMYFGTTTINGGTLRFGNGAVGPGFVFNTITDNAAIEFNTPGAVGVNPFGGSGSVRVLSGTLNTNGTLTHAGTTTVDGGATLSGAANNNALLTVNGVFTMNNQPSTAGSLTGAGQININSISTLTVGGDNASTTYSGTFGIGGDTLVKVGTGTLTLTGNSGGVVASLKVNAGKVLVNGQHIASNTTVASGATLGGSGFLGPVIVNAGGFLSPGNSPGLLTTASLFLGGTLLQEIQGNVRGAQYDAIDANGGVNLTGATLTLSGAYVPVVGDAFTIIANDGVDPVVGTFAGLAQGTTFNFNGRPLTISYTGGTGNDVVLSALAPAPAAGAAPVPSSSDWMLALLAATLLASGILAARRKLRRAP